MQNTTTIHARVDFDDETWEAHLPPQTPDITSYPGEAVYTASVFRDGEPVADCFWTAPLGKDAIAKGALVRLKSGPNTRAGLRLLSAWIRERSLEVPS